MQLTQQLLGQQGRQVSWVGMGVLRRTHHFIILTALLEDKSQRRYPYMETIDHWIILTTF